MDLTRLYNLTTPELRDEAERLGVNDTYAMSRGQLIQAIRNKAGTPQPEGLLGKVFGFARWALQAAGETSSGSPATAEREPMPVAAPKAKLVPAPEPEPERVAAPVPAPAPVSVPVPVPEPAPAPAPAPEPAAASELDANSGPPSRPPAGVFSKSNGLFDEPFPTRTMARILADQGHFKRSLAIYGRLVDEEPANMELRAEADGVRARSRARRSQV